MKGDLALQEALDQAATMDDLGAVVIAICGLAERVGALVEAVEAATSEAKRQTRELIAIRDAVRRAS